MLRATTVLLIACLNLSPTTLAAECNGEIIQIIIEDGSPGGQGFYIDDRSSNEHPINHWIYLESNGEDGLQSGGGYGEFPCKDCLPVHVGFYDSCWGTQTGEPDYLIL